MHKFPPNINPELFTVIGCIVGLIVEDDFNANELNSIGNWLILVGQFILTNAAQQQLIESRLEKSNININSREHKMGGSFYENNGKSNQNQRPEVDFLMDAIRNIQKELEKIKNAK